MNRESVYEQLKIDEGVVYELYNDHLGYATFGVGHLVKESDPEHGSSLGTAISECNALYGEGTFADYPATVQEVLVNMMFNMGRGRLGGFKNFRVALDEGNWSKAAVEGRDSKWHKQVGARAERLMSRIENL